MEYEVKLLPILEGHLINGRISETRVVHQAIQKHLLADGYEVHHERLAFHVPHYAQRLGLRVDFLALKQQEILIVECKGCPFSPKKSLGTLLQLSLYMRVYEMMRSIPNPQMSMFEDFDLGLVRQGDVRGVLAIPYVDSEAEHALNEAAQYLESVQLSEAEIEVWNLRAFHPNPRNANVRYQ